MKKASYLALATLSLAATTRAAVLIDFGRTDNPTAGNYNNVALGQQNTSGPAAINLTSSSFQTAYIASGGGTTADLASLNLIDDTGAASGLSIAFQVRSQRSPGAGQLGTAGSGGDYAGAVNPIAAGMFASTATADSVFVNNSGLLRVTISGLTDGMFYDLSVFTGRSGTASGSSSDTWTLITGSAVTSQYYADNSTTPTANTGQLINSVGSGAGDLIQWLGVASSGGQIAFDLASQNTTSGAIASLNALSISASAVPEPATYGLIGAGMLAGFSFVRRRRR